MGIFLESAILEIFFSIICIGVTSVLYYLSQYKYWKNRAIPYLEPSFPFGNMRSLILREKTFGLALSDLYTEFKKQGLKYGGYFMFAKPIFFAADPEIVKQIMIKDFNYFQDRGIYVNEEVDPLGAHLFSIGGHRWRVLRNKLSPTFTSGKMKMMFHTITSCGQNLEVLIDEITRRAESIDIKDVAARFTTDVISSCAFGLECNSLKNPEAEFRKQGRRIFEMNFLDGIKNVIGFMMPSILQFFRARILKKDISDFFIDAVRQTIDYREKNNIDRKDMLSLLLKLKNNESLNDEEETNSKTSDDDSITFFELAAQCFVFFVAGFETSSTTMTFALFELSLHQEMQDKLRDEVRNVLKKHNGQLTYEAVNEMQYLDKVVSETLRKYPALPFLNRVCNYDWPIPGTDQIVSKGTSVVISNYGMQMDPEYYPDPEKFDPERFSEEEKAKRPAFTYLPFGDGPRNCIGMRFGLTQTKVGLASLLKNHRFTLHPRTVLPICYDINMVILSHKYGVYLQSTRV